MRYDQYISIKKKIINSKDKKELIKRILLKMNYIIREDIKRCRKDIITIEKNNNEDELLLQIPKNEDNGLLSCTIIQNNLKGNTKTNTNSLKNIIQQIKTCMVKEDCPEGKQCNRHYRGCIIFVFGKIGTASIYSVRGEMKKKNMDKHIRILDIDDITSIVLKLCPDVIQHSKREKEICNKMKTVDHIIKTAEENNYEISEKKIKEMKTILKRMNTILKKHYQKIIPSESLKRTR